MAKPEYPQLLRRHKSSHLDPWGLESYRSQTTSGLCSASWAADEGVALYKSMCLGCHGASGEGQAAIKAPALKGTSLDASQITERITKGETTSKPPHNKGISGVCAEQAKSDR